MSTHPHGKNTFPGSSLDKAQQRPSSPMSNTDAPGAAFRPFFESTGVTKMTVQHRKVPCRGCGAHTWHAHGFEVPACAHCGGPLAAEDVAAAWGDA